MNIFIDCGTHLFQGFREFAKKYDINSEWKCFCFEANPFTYKKSSLEYDNLLKEGYNITHFNKAVYNEEGKISINCSQDDDGPYSDGHFSQASNILTDPPDYDHVYHYGFNYLEEKVEVESINFSKFLQENINDGDFVVVKMDIEGAEFSVLPSIIDDKSFKLISHFYCEFHERFFEPKSKYKALKQQYINIFKDSDILFEEWM